MLFVVPGVTRVRLQEESQPASKAAVQPRRQVGPRATTINGEGRKAIIWAHDYRRIITVCEAARFAADILIVRRIWRQGFAFFGKHIFTFLLGDPSDSTNTRRICSTFKRPIVCVRVFLFFGAFHPKNEDLTSDSSDCAVRCSTERDQSKI